MPCESLLCGLCDALDWRPLEFVNLSPVRICSLCNVVPSITYLLECSHQLCDVCYEDVIQGDRRCPLDGKYFDEDLVGQLEFTPRQVEKQELRCVNWREGCDVVGTVEHVKSHFSRDCAFHAIVCKRCDAKVLRRDIVKHYTENLCQREGVLPGVEYVRGDVSDSERKTYILVGKNHVKFSTIADQLSEHQQLLNRLLEQQEREAADVRRVVNALHEHVQFHEQVYGNVVNSGKALETSMDAVNIKLSALEEGMQYSNEIMATNAIGVAQIVADLKDVTTGIEALREPLQEVKSFVNVTAETRETKPIAKALFDATDKVKSMEGSLRAALHSDSNTLYFHVQDFVKFREKGVASRYSEVLKFCGYSVKLQVEINQTDVPSAWVCVCTSARVRAILL